MLPRSVRLLPRTPHPPPSRLLSSSSALLCPRAAPSSARPQAAPPPPRAPAALRRAFSTAAARQSAKRDWENQPKAGEHPAAAAEGEGEGEPTAAAAVEDADQEGAAADAPSTSPSSAHSSADTAADKKGASRAHAGDAHTVSAEDASAQVHEGVLPPSSSASAEHQAASSTSPPSPPAAKQEPSAPAEDPSSPVAAKLASKARAAPKAPGSRAGRKKAASSAASAAHEPTADELDTAGERLPKDLPEYAHTLVLPVTSSLLPPYIKNYTFTEPSVIRAVRALAAARIDQLGVFLLRPPAPPPSSSPPSPGSALAEPPKPENVDVIRSTAEVYPTGLLCRIKSSRPGTVYQAQDGGEVVSSWNVELEPVRRIVLSAVEVGVDAPIEAASEAVESGAVIEEVAALEEEGEGDVASFEKVESTTVAAPATLADPLELLRSHAVSIGSITHVPSPVLPAVRSTELRELESLFQQELKDWAGKAPQDVQQTILALSHEQGGIDFFQRPLADQLDIVAGFAPKATNEDRQAVVDALELEDRLRAVLFIVKKELWDLELRAKIHREMKARLDERQKEAILGEQMRAIRKELGHDKANGKDELVERFRKQAAGLRMPEEVSKAFESEMSKLAMLDQNSSEFNVVRNYVDWIVSVPWGKRTVDSFSIPSSIRILDEDHYGLADVKDRILEFLAVGTLRGTVEGKILCLVGPPGVGKTSIAKSIARALDRKFFRISVGGLRDVAEIKGHRRTYVAAMPGKAVQALKQTQAENPLILIDEIDKMAAGGGGGSWGGDPSSALLEMLDPEQNGAFTDHYLDLPVDLSKTLFVCTANSLQTIPAPLLDRMEVLEVSGYVSEEKRAIAKGYLSPQAKLASGLGKADVEIEESAVDALIQFYCRESGVRNLKKAIEKIYRKAAFKIVKDLSPEGVAPAAERPAVEVETAPESTAPAQGSVPEPAVSVNTQPAAAESSTPAATDTATATQTLPAGTTTTQVVKPLEVPSSVSVRITADNLKDYVGPPVFQKDRIYPFAPPPGVVNGLGYTGNGSGSLLPIEISVMPGKGSIQLTGKLGDVIKESVNLAISYLRANAFALGIAVKETDIILGGSSDRDIHLHMPEGAVGKDGPSAGVAILTALVSLMTKTKVDPDLAMTGEITLGGQVIPVGGLKEKILAAHRANIKKLIIPEACRGDVEENVHASVKQGIDIVYVSNVREVLYEVFGELPVAESWRDKYPLLELYGAADGPAASPGSSLNA